MKLLKIVPVLFAGFILATACSSVKKVHSPTVKIKRANWKYMLKSPPNGVKISNNFYCDQTEITNFFWKEYTSWNADVFGKDSKEYKASLPDSTVWTTKDGCLEMMYEYYLSHPAYRDYPIVGITQQQALEYTKWRSDMVFQYVLIKTGRITPDESPNPETYFTIERYFAGTLSSIVPGKEKATWYPEFRLPTFDERIAVQRYADSLDDAYFEKNHSKRHNKCLEYKQINVENDPCVENFGYLIGRENAKTDQMTKDVTWNVYAGCHSGKGDPIYCLRGNAAEWLSEPNAAAGGSWADSYKNILNDTITTTTGANATTGFRNVCVWKQRK